MKHERWQKPVAQRAILQPPSSILVAAIRRVVTVRLINGIALDECQDRERYPARRPFNIPEREVDQATFICTEALSRWKRPAGDVFLFARVAQPAEARRRERRQCRCESCHEYQFSGIRCEVPSIR
jgi:formylmethanofuran dehydrogenase subunit E